MTIHAGLAESVRRISAEWLVRGGDSFYRIDSIGGYNCRKITGGNILSSHGLGVAVDINPARNPFSKARPAITDMPTDFIALWKNEGWGWGGDWTGTYRDAMHFSKHPREYGDGELWR